MTTSRHELPELGDDVHLWAGPLPDTAALLGSLWTTLSLDERARAERFVFQRDRAAFVAARGILRHILGRYLGQKPADIAFHYGPLGKPRLLDGSSRLEFNLSHSHDFALYAVSARRPVGVDVEAVRDVPEALSIAERYFSADEFHALARLAPSERSVAFFQIWTRKEAYIKAVGRGLSLSLSSFSVRSTDDAGRVTVWHDRSSPGNRLWQIETVLRSSGFVAAVAAPGTDWTTKPYTWHDLSRRTVAESA